MSYKPSLFVNMACAIAASIKVPKDTDLTVSDLLGPKVLEIMGEDLVSTVESLYKERCEKCFKLAGIALSMIDILPPTLGIKFTLPQLLGKTAMKRIYDEGLDLTFERSFFNCIKEGGSRTVELVDDDFYGTKTVYQRNDFKLPDEEHDKLDYLTYAEEFAKMFPGFKEADMFLESIFGDILRDMFLGAKKEEIKSKYSQMPEEQ